MKQRYLVTVLSTVLVGGFVGFNASSPPTVMANELLKIRVVDVPATDIFNIKPISNEISIDLQNEKVSLNGNVDNTTVTIRKQDVVVPVKEVKIVEKYIYEPNIAYSTKLLKNLMPLSPPKINVDRNLRSKAVYKCYKLHRYLSLTKPCNVEYTGYEKLK